MATALDPTLEKKEFHNWLKGAISVVFSKEGLSGFVQTEIIDFQKDLIQQNGIAPGRTCGSCTTANVLTCPTPNFCSKGKRCNKHDKTVPDKTPNVQCRNNLCNGIKDWIQNQHRYNQPSWNNSDATKWCVDAFELAKCFLPPDGYYGKQSLADTDFNGTISMIINNKRFQNKMTTQLNVHHNICLKARDIINENIRHSGRNELSDLQLAQCIDALRDVLRDSKFLLHDQQAQVAVNKLQELQKNTLIISVGDITRALEENIRDCLSQQQQEAVEAIKKYLDIVQTTSVAALESIKSAALYEIRKAADDKKQELLQLSQQQHTHNDDILLKEFKEELVRYYKKNESMISASPLVEDHAVPLSELYVQPPMSAFIKPVAFGQGNKHAEKMAIRSYRELFFKDGKDPYTNIYVEANAGYGKTSFTQKVAMTWCQPNMPTMKTAGEFVDEHTLQRFDLLFLLHLRDFQDEDTCLLDDLIVKFVARSLPEHDRFSERFIKSMLRTRPCLIVCDGLDEWTHPGGKCVGKPGIPHNNYGDNCTVLTTTRPWKLSTVGLTPNLIDRHVEISTLDDTTSEELKGNAVKLLSKNSGEEERDLTDFDRKVESVNLGDIRLIPYILLQLICIWFDGLSIGKSKCETYSNTIELTLARSLKKINTPTPPTGNTERNVTVPECMKHNVLCNQYVNLLLKLGKLAFYALFQKIKESSLVIERTTVLTFLTEQELEFCLKIGLLSQSKDSGKVSVKRYKTFFQHKSVQEFLAALYITSEWNNETIQLTILEFCSSLSRILEMENLFVFVCGMNPVVYTCISGELQKIVDIDGVICRCRTYMYTCIDDDDLVYYDDRETMISYQSMQLHCVQESLRNGNESCPIPIYFVIDKHSLTYDLSALKSINNESNEESVQVSLNEKMIAFMMSVRNSFVFMQALDYGVFNSLESLTLEGIHPVWLNYMLIGPIDIVIEPPLILADILTESARTLRFLKLSLACFMSDISITALTGLTSLQSLCLNGYDIDLTHSNLKCLYGYISQTTTLSQLKLANINCCDHHSKYHDCDVTLDIHHLNKLKRLYLSGAPCREVHINPACLKELEFWPPDDMITASASATLWQDLRGAPVLSSLTLYNMISCQEIIQIIPTLTHLQYLKLAWIDLCDGIPQFSPAMTKLECVEFHEVAVSSAAWKELFLSVSQLPRSMTFKLSLYEMTFQEWRELLLSVGDLPQTVTVELFLCYEPSRNDLETIVNMIQSTPKLSRLSISTGRFGRASLTLKNQ